MLERIELRQRMAGAGIGAALAWQMSRSVAGVLWQQVAFLAVAARLGLETWKAYFGLEKYETQRKRFSNEGDEKFDTVDLTPGQ